MTALPPSPQALTSSSWLAACEHAVAHSEAELTAFESELRARMEDLEATAAAVSSRVDALRRQAAGAARKATELRAEASQHAEPRRMPAAAPKPEPLAAFPSFHEVRAPGREVRPRAACTRMQAQVDLASDSNFYSGFSSDLEEGGLFVATVNLVEPGTE